MKKRLFPPFFTYFVDNFGLAVVYPLFSPLFLSSSVDLLPGVVSLFDRTLLLGLLIASFPAAQLFGAPLFGTFSDRVGRKRLFLFTLAGSGLGYLIAGFALIQKNLIFLWIGRVFAGFFAGNLTLCLSAVADYSRQEAARRRHFGWVGSIGGISFIVAIIIGSSFGNIAFFLASLLAFAAFAGIVFFYEEAKDHPPDKALIKRALENLKKAWQVPQARSIFFAFFLFMFSWSASVQFFSSYLILIYQASDTFRLLAFMSLGLSWAFASFIILPLLLPHFSASRLLQFSLFGQALFLFFTLIPHSPPAIFLFHFIAAAFFAALAWSSGFAAISLSSKSAMQGARLGITQGIGALAMAFAPLIGGPLSGIDIHYLYTATGLAALCGGLVLFKKTA